MTLEDLRVELRGSSWIADREPVGLGTSRIGDKRGPSGRERRAAVEQLVAEEGHDPGSTRIFEGVFLVTEQRSIAVVETAAGDRLALLEGAAIPVAPVMRELSASRQLSHAVGVQLGST